MNVYTGIHSYYCGIDLHARSMYVCILDSDGKKVFIKTFGAAPIGFYRLLSRSARILSLMLWRYVDYRDIHVLR